MAPKPYELRNYVRGAAAAARQRSIMARTGETFAGQKLWEDREIAVCHELYPDYRAIRRKLRRRTLIAIQRKCNELQLVPPRLAWTGADVTKLRRLYAKATTAELLAAFPGRSMSAIKHAANSRGILRPKKPYKRTGHKALDALRDRCFDEGIIMRDLDTFVGAKSHFAKQAFRRCKAGGPHLGKAIEALGGQITIEWDDDNA